MNCPNCGASLQPGGTRCRKCGSAVAEPAEKVQPASPQGQGSVNVIVQMAPTAQPVAPQPIAPQAVAPIKSKMVAGILGIFLGIFGAHRFYLGFKGIGTIQLLITILTCFLGSLITGPWGVIEGILILTGSINRDAWGRPLN